MDVDLALFGGMRTAPAIEPVLEYDEFGFVQGADGEENDFRSHNYSYV